MATETTLVPRPTGTEKLPNKKTNPRSSCELRGIFLTVYIACGVAYIVAVVMVVLSVGW